jgi:hypothetical protein
MKAGNGGVAKATVRLAGGISRQKGKAWIIKDLKLKRLDNSIGVKGLSILLSFGGVAI